MGSPTLQPLQDPILLTHCVCFGGGFPNPRGTQVWDMLRRRSTRWVFFLCTNVLQTLHLVLPVATRGQPTDTAETRTGWLSLQQPIPSNPESQRNPVRSRIEAAIDTGHPSNGEGSRGVSDGGSCLHLRRWQSACVPM